MPGPLSVSGTVLAALKLYGADAIRLWQVIAIVVIPIQALVFLLRLITVPGASVAHGAKIYVAAGVSDSGFVAISSLGQILAALALLLSVGAAYRILLGRHLHHPADVATSFSFAVERFAPLLWVSILVGVISGIGFVLFIIPGIYAFVCFAVAVPVLMAEDSRGFTALSRSRQLISDHWWHAFGATVIAVLVAVVGEVVVSLVGGAIVRGVTPNSIAGLLLINAVVEVLVSIIFYPVSAAVAVVLYVDLLLRKGDPHLPELLA